jgi:hypothetical protein
MTAATDKITSLEKVNIGLKKRLDEKDTVITEQEKRIAHIETQIRADYVLFLEDLYLRKCKVYSNA